jgi:hypothetical protein
MTHSKKVGWRGSRCVVALVAGVIGACGSGVQKAGQDAGGQDAPTVTGSDACAFPCYTVVVGGAPGSPLPDPGLLFVQSRVRYLVADPHRNVVYGSTYDGNGVEAISTVTGERLWLAGSGAFGADRLVVSDDGSKIYATDHGVPTAIARFDVATGTVELFAFMPTDPGAGEAYETFDIAAVPGAPHSVIASTSSRTGPIVVFDDDVARPDLVPSLGADALLQMDDPSTIYALSEGKLATLMLTPTGVQAGASAPLSNLFGLTTTDDDFLFDGERLYGSDGHVVDPRAGSLLGMFDPGHLAVDRDGGRVYVAGPLNGALPDEPITIVEYDRIQFTRLRTWTSSRTVPEASQIVRASDGTLAVRGLIAVNPGYIGFLLVRPEAWSSATAP